MLAPFVLAPFVLALFLAGCGTSLVANVDGKISEWTASDCSMDRFFRGTGPYCREAPLGPDPSPALYCHRTLGQVECYDEPDPWSYKKQTDPARPPEPPPPPPT